MTRRFYQEHNAPYRLHPVDVPPKTSYTEKPSRVPELTTDVIWPTMVALMLAVGFCWAAAEILGWEKSLAKGIGLGAGVAFLFLIWRLRFVLDAAAPSIEEREYQEMAWTWDEEVDRFIPLNNGRGEVQMPGHRTIVGLTSQKRITLTGRQIRWFLAQIDAGNDHLRRDTTSLGIGTADPEDGCGIGGSRFSLLKELMEENKLIDDRGRYTPEFEQWLGVRTPLP